MNRLEWILGILLVVLLIVVAVLSLLFWFRPDEPNLAAANSATVIAARADDIAPTPSFEGQTAQTAYAVAQQTAVSWQSDAQLLQASATWPQGADVPDLLSGETTWGFTFYSPSSQQVATISVVENEATLISSSDTPDAQTPLQVTGWNVDSRDAVRTLLSEGGETFIRQAGVTVLTANLLADNQQQNNRLEWLLALIGTQNGRTLTLRVDATSGDIIERIEN